MVYYNQPEIIGSISFLYYFCAVDIGKMIF